MRKSIMQHSFSNVPEISIPRSTFDRSHGLKTTFDADKLIPVLIDEVLPGDTFNCEMSFLARLATPYFPIMDELYLDSFFFFVPYRLVWSNFKKFMGEQIDPGDSIDYTIPVIDLDSNISSNHGCLLDYMGIPLIDYNTSNYTCSALPVRAYFRIWNEWFRDENLQDSNDCGLIVGDGPDIDSYGISSPGCATRGKRHDYFTSCLPWLQKGDAVELPLGEDALIYPYPYTEETNPMILRKAADDAADGIQDVTSAVGGTIQGSVDAYIDPNDRLYADLSSATAATVNEVRQAFQVQRFLEKDARAGTRYVEIVRSHYGVSYAGGDARFQRPEYLGGGSSPINVTPIPVTSDSGSFEAGELSAMGTGYGKHNFIKSFTEHGVVIGLVNVRGAQTYQEGFERFWHRSTRYDVYHPVLANLSEMAVLNREIYIDDATITAGTDDDVFGYQEPWADYRYKPSKLTGLMRSNAGSSLDAWHLSEEFGTTPVLNSSFIQSNASEGIDRAIQAPSEPQFIFQAYFNYKCTRPMPVHGVPGLIDHF